VGNGSHINAITITSTGSGTTGNYVTFPSTVAANNTTSGAVVVGGGIAAGGNGMFGGNAFGLNGSPGAANAGMDLIKTVGSIANGAATTVLTITIPNAAHSALVHVALAGALGAGGAVGADEATGTVVYDVAVSRTAGANAVAVISAAYGAASANVASGATITISAALAAVSGGTTASNTIAVQVTITAGSGSSTNHTCQVRAQVLNANATGITLS
jgi:hypothetical protein